MSRVSNFVTLELNQARADVRRAITRARMMLLRMRSGRGVDDDDFRALDVARMQLDAIEQVVNSHASAVTVTKRADGAYTAGPPPDGRSVNEHLDDLAAANIYAITKMEPV